MSTLPRIPRERAARLFDGSQAALVWLAVLALAVPEPDVTALALSAMAAIALAAAFVALCPAPLGPARAVTPEEDEPRVL